MFCIVLNPPALPQAEYSQRNNVNPQDFLDVGAPTLLPCNLQYKKTKMLATDYLSWLTVTVNVADFISCYSRTSLLWTRLSFEAKANELIGIV